ncbi:Conserved hypothetical protein [gamma proteobacterium HdN1]|nr:Conserved hypothetical protein [gamma proteobacterium HdN1]
MSKEQISVWQLQPGLYIELPLKWHEHPFLRGRFLIQDAGQLEIIRGLNLEMVWFFPDKSTAAPLTKMDASADTAAESDQATAQTAAAWKTKQQRTDVLRQRRERVRQVEKEYEAVAAMVKDCMFKMRNHPVQAMHESGALIKQLADSLDADESSLLHLMNPSADDDDMYYHALNVSILSMLVGKSLKLPRALLEILGSGGLFHDIGKIKVPHAIVRNTGKLNPAETRFLEMHTKYGAELIEKYGKQAPEVVQIAAQHHERQDGSGFPAKLRGKEIAIPARIVALVNEYDNLCNHLDPEKSVTPYEALSTLFSKMAGKFDKGIIQHLVRLLGVYPPGTIVQLSDGGIGMVITVNANELLWPSILMYDPEIPKQDAVIFDLSEDRTTKIVGSLRPRQLEKDVYKYLSPRERVSYFYKQMDKKTPTGG